MRRLAWILGLLALGTNAAPARPVAGHAAVLAAEDVYEEDIAFALDALEEQCRGLLRRKEIDWKKVRKEFTKAAKKVRSDTEHLVLCQRLIARLEDGHARVDPGPRGGSVEPPAEWKEEKRGPGLFLCQVGKKYYVKNAWSAATDVGLAPGMEVLSLEELPMKKWVPQKLEELRDLKSFSTDHHALFYLLHRGLAKPSGDRLKIEYKDLDGKKRKRTITYRKASLVPNGVAYPPQDYESLGDSVRVGHTNGGNGYIHFRRTKGDVVEELDEALARLGKVPGLVLDFRGNSGGGCDHDAFEARFVPEGHEITRLARPNLGSQGTHPYGGPIVVIVDGTTVSAGETTSGMFKEDGRAYMIGESPTAGMSSQKTTVELPSGLFHLYVSTGSNRASFNGGRGIEGLGVPPHELVAFDPGELAQEIDTLLRRADELLADYPQKEVKYDPKDFGWGE